MSSKVSGNVLLTVFLETMRGNKYLSCDSYVSIRACPTPLLQCILLLPHSLQCTLLHLDCTISSPVPQWNTSSPPSIYSLGLRPLFQTGTLLTPLSTPSSSLDWSTLALYFLTPSHVNTHRRLHMHCRQSLHMYVYMFVSMLNYIL